jgi:hypothetical protein
VTAIFFPEAETAMFRGKSPRGKLLPKGERDHPLGSLTGSLTCAKIACATTVRHKKMPKNFLIWIDLMIKNNHLICK